MRNVGFLVSLGIFLFTLSTIFSLFYIGGGFDIGKILNDRYIRHITYFSLYQATLSAILSVVVAIPLSLALYRREFYGKKWLLRLFSMTFVLPVLVAVFGILAIYGNSGFLNYIFRFDSFNIYGLSGILLAHIFFNAPLSSKMIYQNLLTINSSTHKLSSSLGLGAKEKFLYLEWPIIKQQLPHIFGLVFMLCFTSFAIVMALGGGPKSTTIEVAIYQAIVYDFDLNLGAFLALWQILLCTILTLVIQKIAPAIKQDGKSDDNKNFFIDTKSLKFLDSGFIIFSILLVVPPLLGVFYAGFNESFFKSIVNAELYKAFYNSIRIAYCSSILSMFLALMVVQSSAKYKKIGKNKKANVVEFFATIILITPSLVISTGLFIMFNSYLDVFSYAFYFVACINALMALPFILRSLSQPFYSLSVKYDNLSLSLGLRGFARFFMVEFRALRQSLIYSFSLAFVLSFGDLSSIALFGSPSFKTLPLLLYEQMGSYRMDEGAVTALFMLVVSIGVFVIFEKSLERKNAKS